MPVWLTSVIELVVGLVCLAAAWGAWSRLRSLPTALLFVLAGVTASGHASWVLVSR